MLFKGSQMNVLRSTLCENSYSYHMQNRSDFQIAFQGLVTQDENSAGKLLDSGCGAGGNSVVESIYKKSREVHGIDTCESVLTNPFIDQRWHGPFEKSFIPACAYDMAIAYNVLEHIPSAQPFLNRVHSILRPGGSFWALTPNANHPFSKLSRFLEILGLKPWFARHNSGVNNYPAYYRINSEAAIVRCSESIGFSEAQFYFVPCMQWDHYFPSMLRFVPHLFDRIVGLRVPVCYSVLIVRLRK
jgi:2-polyprenyl-3-methyl-5-hydroxy-6-metoxy-1,4-benzoquinol methylase